MAFALPPDASKTKIDKAGEILARSAQLRGPRRPLHLEEATDLAEKWRACHAYPINTFQATLRNRMLSNGLEGTVAQRLKRMPTILGKLRRYDKMTLTTMQDIGGVRAILESPDAVRRLTLLYKEGKRLRHELANEKDYITNPRDADGYRGVHLIYKYVNPRAQDYNGLRIELQIRTRLQHYWATAVETMGTILDQDLKFRQGEQKWLEFFALISSSLARRERCPPVPRFSELNNFETNGRIRALEAELGALNKMSGIKVAAREIEKREAGSASGLRHYLIILNTQERRLRIRVFDAARHQAALEAYGVAEKRASEGEPLDALLVGGRGIKELRRAFPNFFLDISMFWAILHDMCDESSQE